MSAELSVTIYLLVVNAGLYVLPFIRDFSQAPLLNMLLKRACWTLAIYVSLLTTPIIAGIARDNTVAGATEILNVHLFLFGWGGYLFLGFFVLKTLFDLFVLWQNIIRNKRMGDNN